MAKFSPPDPMDFAKPATWPDWKQRFSLYRVATKLAEEDEPIQEHDGILKPVEFCSRSLSDAERRYAQIEKECLAAVWASERFYHYLCGLESYTIQTDHKPLVSLINSKDLDTTPLRCQRLLIRLMKFNPVAVYVPGKNLVAADALSRHPLQSTELGYLEQEVRVHVDAIEESVGVRRPVLEQIKEQTERDSGLQRVLNYTRNGWPDHIKSVAMSAKQYFPERGTLSELNGVLRRGNQIVIPYSMRDDMIQKIHQGHQGLTKCGQRYKNAIWWPGIGNDVRELIQSCRHCDINRPSQHKEPLLTTPLPELPWQKIGADLCEYNGHNYLVIVDYFSRWLEILNLPKTTSESVIEKMKSTFSRWGIPEEVRTDNGPQFSAELFKNFAAEYDFQHVTSSPHFPQSNGMADRAVKTAKAILKQANPHMALLSYRSTPTEPTRESPSKLMMGRSLRTTLPTLKENLRPAWPDLEKVKEYEKQAKQSYEKYYNRRYSAKLLLPLSCGDQVRLKIDGEKTWKTTAVVQQEEAAPRSFTLQTDRGNTPRRNRRCVQLVNRESPAEPPAVPPEPVHPETVHPELSVTQPVSSHPTAGRGSPVVTRSGRMVKPNRRFDT
ncbi:hypothetical protein SKAU_G00241670 [Synaphobranchus kaupii]|uniref:Gypsy retrotransposon integrase-like protein 1 n=1 Tax=Synaphobranchus kaupii TaxID=118154 RepID=A0A9Q1IUE7_SYNKA|nr:hypothetical protein SKAU_G00241670 [Synaphobranchus kaupii]